MVRLTEPEGSVVRPNLAEPPSSADTDADADSSVVHYRVVCLRLECDLYLNASCIRSRLALHYLRDFFIREVIDSKIEAHQTPEKTKKHVFYLTPLRF